MKEKTDKNRVIAKIITWTIGFIAFILLVFILLSPKFSHHRRKIFSGITLDEEILKVTYLYVGQGDATLIQDLRYGGKIMLIDGGPSPEMEEFMSGGSMPVKDYAPNTIIRYLKEQKVDKIDYVVVSHKDGDHIGGLPYIIRNFQVDTVFDNGTDYFTPYVDDLLQSIKETPGVKYELVKAGMEIPFGKNIVCQVIGPLKMYQGTGSDENNSSIVIRLTVGQGISFLFPGDIEIPAELDIMDYGEDLRVTVIKVPHHGSTSSNSNSFLDKINPEIAVFSCGRYNRYGFPSFEIIRRYEKRGAKIYRTDIDGHIEIITDGKNYKIIKQRL